MKEEQENFEVKYYGVRLEMDKLIDEKELLAIQLKEKETELNDIYKKLAKAYLSEL